MEKVNIILTFDTLPQQIFDIEVKSNIYQLEYIVYILSILKPKELKELIKISSQQYTGSIYWLLLESKYYFAKDQDPYWSEIKGFYKLFKTHILSYLDNVIITASYTMKNGDIVNIPINISKIKSKAELLDLVYDRMPTYKGKPAPVEDVICFKQLPLKLKWFPDMYLKV